MKHSNPYYNTANIGDPELFFNRSTGIETLLNSLFSGSPQCLSIIGQRKIGKTSLVQHLSRPTTIQELKYVKSNYLFVYFDCQRHPHALRSAEDFYRVLLNRLESSIPDLFREVYLSLLAESNDDYAGRKWERVLEGFAKENIGVVATFDEFEKAIIREELIKEGFFGSLRGYAQHNPNFAWITCTDRPLHDLFEEVFDEYGISKIQRRSESDFYNIATPYTVGLFDKADTLELITSPAESRGVTFSSEDIETIVKFGGNFPYFVQRACYHFFNAHLRDAVQRESILQQCVKEARQFWEDYWRKLSTEHQMILAAIASGQSTRASVYELEILKEASLVYEDDDGDIKPFSEEFGHFILSLSGSRKAVVASQQIGQLLNNRYEVREFVGDTSHSRVAKAWDAILERVVAIKFLHIDHKPDKAAQQLQKNLLREARILANLRHTHIGQVYDIILEPLGIVMEWVEGPQLQEIIDAAKQLLLTDVINVGIEIADALRYAHTQRRPVIHRDIKPSNIMLTDDEERKSVLIDFDIASASGYETISLLEDGSRGYIGTLEYSAPEQLRKEAVGPLADMFALGVVLYELLADQRPYELGNDPSLYEGGHFPEPERSDIPEPLYQILCKLLREKPDQRPDAKTLKEELQNCLNL